MVGSSPGTLGGLSSLTLEDMSGVFKACPFPCDRGCAARECTVVLPKNVQVHIRFDESKKCGYFGVNIARSGELKVVDLSIDNFVRTLSKCVNLKRVLINDRIDFDKEVEAGVGNEALKALCKSLETVPSLRILEVMNLCSSRLSVGDAKVVFKVLGAHKSLHKCGIDFDLNLPTQASVVKVLVDSLLQNPILQQFSVQITGQGKSKSVSDKEVEQSNGVVRELGRYMKASTNVLKELHTYCWSGDELEQLMGYLNDNKQLQVLILEEMWGEYSGGMIKMGEVLQNNNDIQKLQILYSSLTGKEMKSLVQALIPNATSGILPNTRINKLSLKWVSIEDKEGVEQLATLLQSTTSLTTLVLWTLNLYQEDNENVNENISALFNSLQSNASLEVLKLGGCDGIRGKHVLGMIMDMLLHNHTLKIINLRKTGLEKDGDAEIVHAELRTREEIDQKLEQTIRSLKHVPPNFARVFLCGDPEAGKTTLCNRWREIADKQAKPSSAKKPSRFYKLFHPDVMKKSKKAIASQKYAPLFSISERTRGIEVHKLVWEGTRISLWDMAGQLEYHAFHDLVLPNQSAKGEGCFYFVVCDPSKYKWNHDGDRPSSKLEGDIEYWLMFLASNTRHSSSYRPHVTFLMTHHDKWQEHNIICIILKKIVSKLKTKFQQVLDFDQDLDYIIMDNSASYEHAEMVKMRVEQYLKQLCLKLPKVLKASLELQSNVTQWCLANGNDHILKWEDFSRDLFAQVEGLKPSKVKDGECLEKLKKHTMKALHSGGHIIFFEDIDLVIMSPDWFCNHVIGNILFNCSTLSKACDGEENGIISQDDFSELCKNVLGLGLHKDHYEATLEIMKKLQICYEDQHDKIMIPSLLTNTQDSMGWDMAFHRGTRWHNFVGTKLTSKDDTITLPSEGFFPRLQVFLHDKFARSSYKIYTNVISFIYKDMNVFIVRKDGSINIMSQSANSGDGDHAHHALHKMIIKHINDLRQKPTLGCPGVILEEHSIWPRCVEHPFNGKLQSVSKKHLKDVVLRTGDLKYEYQWMDEKNCVDAIRASELLGDEEWHEVLDYRAHVLKEMVEVLDRQLVTSSKGEKGPSGPITDIEVTEPSSSNLQHPVLARIESLKRLIQCNHKEVMERLNVMESKIIRSQEALAARVCSNIDDLMKYSLQLKNSKIPKLPYIMQLDDSKKRRFLFKAIPGLMNCHINFRCEHNDYGFHTMEDQPGCEILVSSKNARRFGTVMYWGLVTTTMLLKVGAHLAAPGMGNMVPDLAQGLATILDTPGLLDMSKPKGQILERLPAELKTNSVISLEDNEQAKEWLVKLLETKGRSIYDMFNLTQVVYASKSGKKQEMGWVCDAHKPREQH